MEDYRLEQSGQEVQDILNGAAMQSDLTAETERATEAEQTLQGNIDIEERDRKAADLTLQGNIDAEELRAKAAEKQNADDIDALEEKVPSGASSSNKLATEEYVDDSVATATATFRGTYNLVSDLHLTVDATEQQIATALALAISTADNNDYCFVQVPTSSETPTEIKEIDRYKFNGTAWSFEYKLNNSGFTAAQWAAINSGITSGDVTKLAALPTNAQLTTLLNGKQDVLTFDNVPTEGSSHPVKSGGVYSAIDDEKTARETADRSLSSAIEAILLLIPSAATSLNKLADKAFVNSSIATASATFRGTYNLVTDLSLTVSATHAQIATALAGAVSDEDNNDYAFVQIPTSDATPTQIAKTERYKFNGNIWEYEYDLNNSGYTAAQWAAINSGITEALVTKLSALPTNAELTSALGVLTSSITTINQKIPSAASQANQLVDTAAMESYIVQVLDVLTASFNVTSTDGHVTVSISQVDGKITSVSVSTSDIASAASLSLIAGRVTTAEGNISTNAADIANLQDAYAALTQSAPVIVQPTDTWPVASPASKTIYRVVDRVNTPPQNYSDYIWNGSAMVLMATYDNAIDDVPTAGSNNLVKSGGVEKVTLIKPLIPSSTISRGYFILPDGATGSGQWTPGSTVYDYPINDGDIIKMSIPFPAYAPNYIVAAAFKNNVMIRVFAMCTMSEGVYINIFKNDIGADMIRVCSLDSEVAKLNISGVTIESKDLISYNRVAQNSEFSNKFIRNNGELEDAGSGSNSSVMTYSLQENSFIKLSFNTSGVSANYLTAALYKNGYLVKAVAFGTGVGHKEDILLFNDFGADELKISVPTETKSFDNVVLQSNQIVLDSEIMTHNTSLNYQTLTLKSFDEGLEIGDTISLVSSNYRNIDVIYVPELKGHVSIKNILASGHLFIAAVNKNNQIVKLVKNLQNSDSNAYGIADVNLDEFTGDEKIFAIYVSSTSSENEYFSYPVAYNYNISVKGRLSNVELVTPKKKAVMIFHVDGFPTGLDDERLSIFEEYGVNVSWYIQKAQFGGDNTFASPWVEGAEALYKQMLKRGDDFGLYPAMNAAALDENGWKSWIRTALTNLALKGVHNLTTFCCGQLAINDDLYNAVHESNSFKIIRGGMDENVADINTYQYTDKNIFMPLEPTNDTFLVNSAKYVLAEGYVYQNTIDYLCATKTAMSVFIHYFDDLSEQQLRDYLTYAKAKVDSGELEFMTWREYYATVNKYDGETWDYNRLIKMFLN